MRPCGDRMVLLWLCWTAKNRTKSYDWTSKATMAKKVTFVCFSVTYIKVSPVCAGKLNEVHGTTYMTALLNSLL